MTTNDPTNEERLEKKLHALYQLEYENGLCGVSLLAKKHTDILLTQDVVDYCLETTRATLRLLAEEHS